MTRPNVRGIVLKQKEELISQNTTDILIEVNENTLCVYPTKYKLTMLILPKEIGTDTLLLEQSSYYRDAYYYIVNRRDSWIFDRKMHNVIACI